MSGLLALQQVYEVRGDHVFLHAMPVVIAVLGLLAVVYASYSRFLANRVVQLNDANTTPAHALADGQNYHATNRWVLFGHHFAAISGAGPLIGPVLAMQFGYMPGLLWLVAGVCLAGAVQDMLVLAASVRHEGKSLGHIARIQLGPVASAVVSAAILFVVIIALAGLGIVVVKALGGEEIPLQPGSLIKLPAGQTVKVESETEKDALLRFPNKCELRSAKGEKWNTRSESFQIRVSAAQAKAIQTKIEEGDSFGVPGLSEVEMEPRVVTLPEKSVQVVPGSSWGTFTIACTIPIALFVGLWMYKIRKGQTVEASLIGATAVIAATIAGNWIPGSALEPYFSLTREQTIIAMVIYGFTASVLPVWLLLCPRDYLSSFLKIGTIFLLVVGVCVSNPLLKAAPLEQEFVNGGGPTFSGSLFPFVFICIMCGAVSGFHALVSSGTTPKMINKESDIRPIGYGGMLMESLVGVMALVAAASLHPKPYFEMNTKIEQQGNPELQAKLDRIYSRADSLEDPKDDPLHQVGVKDPHQLKVEKEKDLAEIEEMVGGESLRGRTAGAVTLAVGMSFILTDAMSKVGLEGDNLVKYWFHFAIMFEALFILTTIDTGTRIARLLVQETLGKIYARFGQTDWWPSAILATFLVVAGWGGLIWTGSVDTIWPMFGISNQLLAVIALCLVTTWLVNTGRGRYIWVTLLPMVWVISTTMTAGVQMINGRFVPKLLSDQATDQERLAAGLNTFFTLFVMACVLVLLLFASVRWAMVFLGKRPTKQSV